MKGDFDINAFLRWRSLSERFDELTGVVSKWAFIRQAYMEAMPGIMGEEGGEFLTSVVLPWDSYMTKHEWAVWETIRCSQSAFLPQFPVFNYFIDFANPRLCLALEVDGKEHKEEKDRKRDALLWSIGWRTFRIPYTQVFNPENFIPREPDFDMDDPDQEEAIKTWLFESADGIVKALEWVYFTDRDHILNTVNGPNLLMWAEQSLYEHQLIRFPLRGEDEK